MGRNRKAWLSGGTGIRIDRGRRLPGYYVEWHDHINGVRVHRSRRFSQAVKARQFVKQFNARLELGLLGQVIPISLRDAVSEFVAGLGPLAPATAADYMTTLGFLAGTLGDGFTVSDLTASILDNFIQDRLGKATEATAAKHVRNLRRFLNWAVSRNYLLSSPIAGVTTRPSDNIKRNRPSISDDDLSRVIDSLEYEDQRIACWLARTTGLDRGVINQLATRDVFVGEGIIRVQRPKTRRKGVRSLVVPIHPSLLPMLVKRLNQSDPLKPILSGLERRYEGEDWWDKAVEAAGCPGLLFRDLRAVASSRPQRLAGLSLADAQKLLGHSTPAVTAGHYMLPDPDVVRRLNSLPLPGAPGTAKPRARKRGTSGR